MQEGEGASTEGTPPPGGQAEGTAQAVEGQRPEGGEPPAAAGAAPEAPKEPAPPPSEHAGIISDLDRLMCVYYGQEVANDLVALVEGEDVLLVGCEDGYVLSALALAGFRVTTLDYDAGNLRKCQKVLRGWEQIHFVQLEGRSFPFEEGSFDSVLVSLFAHHANNPGRVFEEVSRVLRPGGALVLADLLKHEETWTMDELHDVWLGFTDEELRNWLEGAGLSDIQVRSTEQACSGSVFEGHKAVVPVLILTARKGD